MRKHILFSACILIFTSFVSGQQWLYFPTGIPKNWVNIGDLDVPGSAITIEALITLKDLSSVNILSKHTDPSNVNYLMRHHRFEMTTSGSGFIILNNPVPFCIDSTYHVAATYNGDSVKYYVNGFRVASQSWSGDLAQNNLETAIGNISVGWANEQFFGYIDELRIWNVARSRAQIAANMYDLPNPTLQSGLLAYYKFEGNFINLQGDPAYNGVPVGSELQTTTNPYFTGSVSGLIVHISITASDTSVCEGTLVEFAAIPSNGGTFPFYQWKVNGVLVGTNSPFYTYVPMNDDRVTCTLTSSATCVTGNPATSDPIIMTVNPMLPVSVTIDPDPPGAVCSGTLVTFTANPVNGGPSPAYQWKVNGLNAGTNNPLYTYMPVDNDKVTCILTSSDPCAIGNPATSNEITMTVNSPVSVSVSVSSDPSGPVCSGTSVTFTAVPVNGGTSPSYQWNVNGMNQGIDNPVFSYMPADDDTVLCILTSSDTICITNNPAISDPVVMTVYPLLPVGISIGSSDNPSCEGDTVTFTATPVNPGTSPLFQWFVNGVPAGFNDSVFSYPPVYGDLITCSVLSTATCAIGNPAFSDTITMEVYPILSVGVTIVPSPHPVCEGFAVTFTATPTNGGTNPSYQWQVNGMNAGMNNAVFTYVPTTGDLVSCILTSSEQCTVNNPASSIPYPVSVVPAPIVTFAPCFDTISATNAKPIRLKGGIPLGGIYSGPGVNPVSGILYPAIAGPGIHQITYNYTNSALCSSFAYSHIRIFPYSPIPCNSSCTDIRDSTVYPTVQIGTQCWFAENLNYGTEISYTTLQRDNCIPEKYKLAVGSWQSAIYQWDELMCYSDSEEIQGLCPPGWHVPSESDWQILFTNWTNNAFAGAPLKYSGYSGFNALLTGAGIFNRSLNFDGFATFFWSSTSHGAFKAWSHGLNELDHSVSFYPSFRSNAFSVRCLRD